MYSINLQPLYDLLQYTFTTPALLQRALTHRSVSQENNERFEFLGDSVLDLVIAHEVFIRFPHYTEGELSRLRAYLVKEEMLASIALDIHLGDFLYLGYGELKTGGAQRLSTLADALEAVIAAVFLDGGFHAANRLIQTLFATHLQKEWLFNDVKDAKSMLQEYLQAKKLPLPKYELLKTVGGEHHQVFYISCTVKGFKYMANGSGFTRRKAEQEAAKKLLHYFIKK